ncbi:alkaline phosphatase, tissue-nonspecific isozyme-like [Argonauta hians]
MSLRCLFCVMLLLFLASTLPPGGLCQQPTHRSKEEWLKAGRSELEAALLEKRNENIARNVILFLGDGMGISTVTAGRIFKGQQKHVNGESYQLTFDKFPHTALMKTYSEDRITPDSAATATAYLTGVKTNNGLIGLDGRVKYGVCNSKVKTARVRSILDLALDAGKSVGIVTSTRVTHATPAATYAHSPHRDWEYDAVVPVRSRKECKDIARQLIEENPDIQVILGGGRSNFMPFNVSDPEYHNTTGKRHDGRNLIEEWQKRHPKKSQYVWNMKNFKAVDPKKTDFLLGLFEPSHMQYETDRQVNHNDDPSLAEMTSKAIAILSKNSKGFFLLVEGGRIDHGHHNNSAINALTELSSFDDAVSTGVTNTSEEDTLIVVTADHSHVFSIAGYPNRGTDILGKVPPERYFPGPSDGMPMTILVYGNGPGYKSPRENLTDVNTASLTYIQQSAVPLRYETHGSMDVAAYARGPMAHLFAGVKEQNYIAVVMEYASCTRKHLHYNARCSSATKLHNHIVQLVSLMLAALARILVH